MPSVPAPLVSLLLVWALCTGISLYLANYEADDGYETFPSYPSSRYRLSAFHLNWTDASMACQSDGGGSHLVIINSEEEAEVVGTLSKRTGHGIWTGINDIVKEGAWVTVLGGSLSATGYIKWLPGKPVYSRDRNCALVYGEAKYWDYQCSLVIPFICEKPRQ